MSGYFDGVNIKKHTYQPTDYRDCYYFLGTIAFKDKVKSRYDRKSTEFSLSKTETGLFYIANTMYSHRSDGKLYAHDGANFIELCSIGTSTPVGIEIKIDGKAAALFVGEKSYLIVDGVAQSANVDACSCAATHNGRLFTAKENKIKFSAPFDFDNQSILLDQTGYIDVDSDAGDVLGFMSKNDILYIICAHAIFTLQTCLETIDFSLKRLNICDLDIVKDTVSTYNGRCFLVNRGNICAFDGDSIKIISAFFNQESAVAYGKSAVSEDFYALPAKITNSRHLYLLSLKDYSESIFDYASLPLVADGGYHAYGAYVYTFFENPTAYGGFAYMTKDVDFGDADEKTLLGISVSVGCACTLTISGLFGKKLYSLKKGINRIKTNLKSNYFKLDFRGAGYSFSIQNLKYEYAKKGE